jgi:hypothetical protein
MRGFFAGMSFPRGVILVCSLGSLVLGALVYLRSKRLAEVHVELQKVRNVVKEIQTDAYRLGDLQRSASAETFKAQSEPETYIRATAGDSAIQIGQVDITKSTKSPARGIEDSIYKITPQTKTQRCTRGQIGNFLYKLEFGSRRVKVTRLRLWPFEKVAAGEIGKDVWNFEAELTTRTKLETAPAADDSG